MEKIGEACLVGLCRGHGPAFLEVYSSSRGKERICLSSGSPSE